KMAEGAGVEGPRLAELLAAGWRLWEEVDTGTEPSSAAPAVQDKVRRGLEALQQAAAMVAQLDLFSENEDLEEIASADLRYLLLPALLGALTLRQAPAGLKKRLPCAKAKCASYSRKPSEYDWFGVGGQAGDIWISPAKPLRHRVGVGPLGAVARYKQKKELENRLASMRTFVESGQADEDQMREFYILQTQKWINISLEEIESIDQEMVILRSRGTIKQSSAPPHGTSRQVRAPLKPFILTRDAAQAKVFGAGYPGVPTMTVDDWYEQRRRQGVMPGQSVPQRTPGVADEELQKKQQEKKEEEDDEEALQKARNWDDWKDTHPKGYGNRQNMG
ncbi:IGBP1 protein, partial [Casuarius casuarius]|nr:IGBP1 protein [Casuarius casuarius]